MDISRRLTISLLAVLALAGLATAAAPRRYTLRLHPGKGDTATYTTAVLETDTLTGAEASEAKVVSKALLTWVVAFRGASRDGTVRVRSTIKGGPLEVKMGARSQAGRVKDSVTDYVFSPRAEVKEAKLLSGSLPQTSPLGTALSADDVFVPVLLPEKPVKVGDSWQATLQVPAPTGEAGHLRQVSQQSEVIGLWSYAGRPCLRIHTRLSQLQQFTQEAPDGSGPVDLEARGDSDVTWFFDLERGLVVKADSIGTDVATQLIGGADQGRRTVTIRKTITIRSRMTAYNGRKVAAK